MSLRNVCSLGLCENQINEDQRVHNHNGDYIAVAMSCQGQTRDNYATLTSPLHREPCDSRLAGIITSERTENWSLRKKTESDLEFYSSCMKETINITQNVAKILQNYKSQIIL